MRGRILMKRALFICLFTAFLLISNARGATVNGVAQYSDVADPSGHAGITISLDTTFTVPSFTLLGALLLLATLTYLFWRSRYSMKYFLVFLAPALVVIGLAYAAIIGETITDASGNYSLGDIPAGTYRLTASAPGYYRKDLQPVEITEPTTTIPLILLDPLSCLDRDDYESNDHASQAVNLDAFPPDTPLTNYLCSSDDEDWFKFSAHPSYTYNFEMTNISPSLDLNMQAYYYEDPIADENRVLLYSSYCGNISGDCLAITLPSGMPDPSDVYVRIFDSSHTAGEENSHQMIFSVWSPTNTPSPTNTSTSSPTPSITPTPSNTPTATFTPTLACVANEGFYLTSQYGMYLDDLGLALSISADDFIYLAGGASTSIEDQPHQGGKDIFITKFNSDAQKLWTLMTGTASNEEALASAVDQYNNLLLVGYTEGDLAGNANNGARDAFLLKYGQAGDLQWSLLLGTNKDEEARCVTAFGSRIFLAGYTWGDLDNVQNAGEKDIFVACVSNNGSLLWVKLFGTASSEEATGITADSSGYLYLCGGSRGDLLEEINSGGEDAFLIKLNADGNLVWGNLFGSPQDDRALAIALDAGGNPYLAGFSQGGFLGESAHGETDAFACRFSMDGNVTWTRIFGTSHAEWGKSIGIGGGRLFVGGFTEGDLDAKPNNGAKDAFIARFTLDGTRVCTGLLGTGENEKCCAIAVNAMGEAFLAGYTYGDLGGVNKGGQDIFFSKFTTIPPTPTPTPTSTPTPIPTICFFSENLDSDPGWTMNGEWEFNAPQGKGGGQSDCYDPNSAYSGSFVYGYDLSYDGLYANPDSNIYTLTTSPINCSDYYDIVLSFKAWIGLPSIEDSLHFARIDVSADGSFWETVWDNAYPRLDGMLERCDTSWTDFEVPLGRTADNEASTYIRWSIGPTSDMKNMYTGHIGWNIDDLRLCGVEVTPTPTPTRTPVPTVADCSDIWTRSLTANHLNVGRGVAVSPDGFVYVVSSTSEDTDFEETVGKSDVVISKFDSDGNKLNERLLGSPQHDQGVAVSIASPNEIYIVGWTEGSLGGATHQNGKDAFLAKYNNALELQWIRYLPETFFQTQLGTAVAVTPQGDIVVGAQLGVLAKYSPDGVLLWEILPSLAGNPEYVVPLDICVDASGFIYMAGYTENFAGDGSEDIVIAKYNAEGCFQWMNVLSDLGCSGSCTLCDGMEERGYGIDVDNTRNELYLCGFTMTTAQGVDCMPAAFLAKYNLHGDLQWTRFLAGSQDYDHKVYAYSTSVDASGHVFLSGSLYGDAEGYMNHGWEDWYLALYDRNGTLQWLRGNASGHEASEMSVGVASHGYCTAFLKVCGSVGGSNFLIRESSDYFTPTPLPPTPTPTPTPKCEPEEAFYAVNMLGTSWTDWGSDVTADSVKNSYLAGVYGDDALIASYSPDQQLRWMVTWDDARCEGITLNSANDAMYVTGVDYTLGIHNPQGFLGAYDTAGNLQWRVNFAGSDRVEGRAVAADGSDNIYVVGYMTGTMDGLASAGGRDIFIRKFTSSGNNIWTKLLGSSADDEPYDLVVNDPEGVAYLTGFTKGDLGGAGNSGMSDLYLAKVNLDGNLTWLRQYGLPFDEEGTGVDLDADGSVYISGWTSSREDSQREHAGDLLILKYSADGNMVWNQAYTSGPANYEDKAFGIAVADQNTAVITGKVSGSIDGESPASGYCSDIFIMRFRLSDGVRLCTHLVGSEGSDVGKAVTFVGSGEFYITGYAGSSIAGKPHSGGKDVVLVHYSLSQPPPTPTPTATATPTNTPTPTPTPDYILVARTWSNADYRTISEALDAVRSGADQRKTIHVVADGTYYWFNENIPMELVPGVKLMSHTSTKPTIQGHPSQAIGAPLFKAVGIHDLNTTIQGLRIMYGFLYNANGAALYISNSEITVRDCEFLYNKARRTGTTTYGGAIFNYAGDPVIENCNFEYNDAKTGGALANQYGDPVIRDCTFTSNNSSAGGALADYSGGSEVYECAFQDNHGGFGGAAYYWNSFASVERSVFTGNSASDNGGAIYAHASAETSAHLDMKRCEFRENHSCASGGALFLWWGYYDFENLVFWRNAADHHGGAVYSFVTALAGYSFTHCTFNGNEASNGGALYNDAPRGSIYNSIMWGDIPNEVAYPTSAQMPEISCSLVEGGYGDALDHNMDKNPWFMMDFAGDLRLRPVSPCIDAVQFCSSLTEDFTGAQRPFQHRVPARRIPDMGAYEFSDYLWIGPDPYPAYDFSSIEDALADIRSETHRISVLGTYADPSSFPIYLRESSYIEVDDPDNYVYYNANLQTNIFRLENFSHYPAGLDGFRILSGSSGIGGGIRVDNASLVLLNSEIRSCVANKGGAVYVKDGEAEIKNCWFTENTAMQQGGALYFENSNWTVDNCEIGLMRDDNPERSEDYDVVDIIEGGTNIGDNTPDPHNRAYDEGGGIYSAYSTFTLKDTHIKANVALNNGQTPTADGGGMLVQGGGGVIENCVFRVNYAADRGGGLWAETEEPLLIHDCRFHGNSSGRLEPPFFLWMFGGGYGGGAKLGGSQISVENCVFYDNLALHHGGGIYLSEDGVTVRKSLFYKNRVWKKGGGLYSEGADCYLENDCFYANLGKDPRVAVKRYAALYLWSRGGGLYLKNCNFTLRNSTVWENETHMTFVTGLVTATGAGLRTEDCSGDAYHNIFYGNRRKFKFKSVINLSLSDQVYVSPYASHDIQFINNFLEPKTDAPTPSDYEGDHYHAIREDPKVYADAYGWIRLKPDSPARGAAWEWLGYPSDDFEGDTRPCGGGSADIGCDETCD